MTPILSIIMPVKHNLDGFIKTHESLKLILGDDVELVVQDYCGESNLPDLVPKISREKDSGTAEAVNIAIQNATGKYLLFWGAGELALMPDFIKAVNYLKTNSPDILFNRIRIDNNSHTPQPQLIEQGMACLTPGAMILRELFLSACGYIDTQYRIANDYKMFVQLLKATKNWQVTDQTIVDFKLDGISSTTGAFEGYVECELIRIREYGKHPVMAAIDMNGIVQSYLRQVIRV